MDDGTGAKDNLSRALLECWQAGVAAARPGPAVAAALASLSPITETPWLLAVGKAAGPMALAAVGVLEARGRVPAGGLVIAPDDQPVAGLVALAGDHPVPGDRSIRAAEAVDAFCRQVPAGAMVWALLSGGATSLIAAPAAGLSLDDLQETYRVLLGSGLDITGMNQIRKRLTRWGGGQVARALRHRSVLQLIVSDVPDDDLATIGSGPLVPEPTTVEAALASVYAAGLERLLPGPALEVLERIAAGSRSDVVSPVEDTGCRLTSRVVVSSRIAIAAAAAAGRALGWDVEVVSGPLAGEAAVCGRALASRLGACPVGGRPVMLVAGGEPTVTLIGSESGTGGRCQELALAAAQTLRHVHGAVLLLAAGTDGRDGPTTAAGAIVDGHTWDRIGAAGIDVAAALARHDSHRALAAADALLWTGPTGTNVADLVLAVRASGPAPVSSDVPAAQ